ncbi:MAG: DUF4149 domain-containing protein [Myxococcota bacterium]|nr:DUF4149 domain-containing protein [Myxococcota bacterium]
MASAGERFTGALVRAALWVLLGGWLGAWCLFAFSVAPTAFRSLPSDAAGMVVGPVIAALHLYGSAAGVLLALLARALRRGPWQQVVPLVMAGLCLFSEFWVTAQIDAVRDAAFGPDANAEALQRFGRLHGLSMGLYTAVGLLAFVLTGLHAHSDAVVGEAPRNGRVSP